MTKYKSETTTCVNCAGTGKGGPFKLFRCNSCNGWGSRSFNYDSAIDPTIIAQLRGGWPQRAPTLLESLVGPLFR